ncbi:MAG: hypothetical protein AAFZ15_11360 [Bacteroidota bacterium]
MKSSYFALFFILAIFPSCQNQFGCPDIQDNEILTENDPHTEAYQHEMARLISADTHEVDYYFEKRENGHLVLNAFGWGYCGELHLLMSTEDELSQKLQNDGGWRGAKLQGLQAGIVGKRLEYLGMESILD